MIKVIPIKNPQRPEQGIYHFENKVIGFFKRGVHFGVEIEVMIVNRSQELRNTRSRSNGLPKAVSLDVIPSNARLVTLEGFQLNDQDIPESRYVDDTGKVSFVRLNAMPCYVANPKSEIEHERELLPVRAYVIHTMRTIKSGRSKGATVPQVKIIGLPSFDCLDSVVIAKRNRAISQAADKRTHVPMGSEESRQAERRGKHRSDDRIEKSDIASVMIKAEKLVERFNRK